MVIQNALFVAIASVTNQCVAIHNLNLVLLHIMGYSQWKGGFFLDCFGNKSASQ